MGSRYSRESGRTHPFAVDTPRLWTLPAAASAGQTMQVDVTSLEENATFDVFAPTAPCSL